MLNKTIRFFLENKLVAVLLLLVLVGWGLVTTPFSWNLDFLPKDPVPVDAIPDLGENQQIVYTEWAGQSPQDVEDQITYPLTTQLLKKVWDEVSDRPDLFQPVYGAGELGSAIVTSPQTNVICFTGSTLVGRKIAEACAPLFKPVILELGGKDPMIILADADIHRSVDAAIWGGLSNAGQTCISVERIFAHENIYPEIVEKLSEEIQKKTSGKGDTPIGAISVEASLEKIKQQIDDAKNNSEVIEGNGNSGWFIAPTLVVNPPSEAKIMQEETFGPVMVIIRADDVDQALEMANDTEYGLGAGIWTENASLAKSLALQIDSGQVAINGIVKTDPRLPSGGIKGSGYGRELGPQGIKEFVNAKQIWIK